MLKAKLNVKNGKCKKCVDQVECRICSFLVGKLKVAKVIECDLRIHKARLQRAEKLAKMELFKHEGGDDKLNITSS